MHSHSTTSSRGGVIRWATAYDLFFERISRTSDAKIIALAGIQPGATVLDVGCGPGSLTRAAQRAAGPQGAAYGIDPATEMVARAQHNARRTGSSAQFQASGIEALPFPDRMFDVAMGRLMFHHLNSTQKHAGLRELRRVLKPGGVFLTIDIDIAPNGLVSHLLGHASAGQMSRVNMDEYADLYADAGFTNIRTGPTGARFLSYVRGRTPAD
ncbi:MAG: class I SAM-dependent methyltransferase [Kouleothrix sp.]